MVLEEGSGAKRLTQEKARLIWEMDSLSMVANLAEEREEQGGPSRGQEKEERVAVKGRRSLERAAGKR